VWTFTFSALVKTGMGILQNSDKINNLHYCCVRENVNSWGTCTNGYQDGSLWTSHIWFSQRRCMVPA